MRLTVTNANGDIFTLEVPGDIEVENLKAYCEVESEIPSSEIDLLHNGTSLSDGKKTAEQYGLADGDILFLQRMISQSSRTPAQPAGGMDLPPMDFSRIRVPTDLAVQQPPRASAGSGSLPGSSRSTRAIDPYILRDMLDGRPDEVALLRQNNPPLAEAYLSGDRDRFAAVFNQQSEEKNRKERERMALLTGDPFDPEVQRRIAESIQQENVNANMEAAMEHAPESFGQVHMLYIDCIVNGHHVKAFVDSGAQMTIMSKACAERCHISHLIDRRWSGVAKGVGVQRILGRVHMCQIAIERDHLQCSFSILEEQPMDMLLGLDMLKRHQCCIDLRRNLLVIGTTGTETKFLAESDLPTHARLNKSASQTERDREEAEAELLLQNGMTTSRQPPSSSASGSSSQSSGRFPEADIRKLTSNGFSRETAVSELSKTSGNVNTALINLLARSLTTPSPR